MFTVFPPIHQRQLRKIERENETCLKRIISMKISADLIWFYCVCVHEICQLDIEYHKYVSSLLSFSYQKLEWNHFQFREVCKITDTRTINWIAFNTFLCAKSNIFGKNNTLRFLFVPFQLQFSIQHWKAFYMHPQTTHSAETSET